MPEGNDMAHISVLTDDVVRGLTSEPDATIIDVTLGAGGHARALIAVLGPSGRYLGIDADPSAVKSLASLQGDHPKVELVVGNFKDIASIVQAHGIKAPDAILADLGWRMEQFESGQKGFSFQHDEPLLMTYGDPESYPFTAYDIVNDWEESSIADVIYGYGEERASRRIAYAIVEARENGPIKTSGQLADIVANTVPRGRSKIHPATKTFQAFRIAVNDELGVLKTLIHDGFELLRPGGRLAIITFHSIEDRVVKNSFRELERNGAGITQTRKPLTASYEEVNRNPRARSAKLRIIQKQEP